MLKLMIQFRHKKYLMRCYLSSHRQHFRKRLVNQFTFIYFKTNGYSSNLWNCKLTLFCEMYIVFLNFSVLYWIDDIHERVRLFQTNKITTTFFYKCSQIATSKCRLTIMYFINYVEYFELNRLISCWIVTYLNFYNLWVHRLIYL